jgi:hypothetical protein
MRYKKKIKDEDFANDPNEESVPSFWDSEPKRNESAEQKKS